MCLANRCLAMVYSFFQASCHDIYRYKCRVKSCKLRKSVPTLPDHTINTVEESERCACIIRCTVNHLHGRSRSWETDKHSTTTDISPLLWHSKVNFRVQKVSHWITKSILIISWNAIHLRSILMSFLWNMPRPPKWSLLFRFPATFLYNYLILLMNSMCPAHYIHLIIACKDPETECSCVDWAHLR
jgi:hypothetical protein